jgi:16S rRNA (uracil1498-N3)-methyltransferase
VNLILFEAAEIGRPLPRRDPRAVHLLTVLRRGVGDAFDAGLVDGPRGRGTLTAIGPDALSLAFAWGAEPPPLDPIVLVLGLPRPQTARDVLRDATSLGVAAMHFVTVDKGEASYARSTLWSSGEWRRHLLAGAAQAFDTRLPAVTHGGSLLEAVGRLPAGALRVALDNYEAGISLERLALPRPSAPKPADRPVVALAIGAERGWSEAERAILKGAGFVFAHLGTRVLRTETAVTVAVALAKAKLGWS